MTSVGRPDSDISPVYGLPAGPAEQCDRCGGWFERPIFVEGVRIAGHPKGDPRLCIPMKGQPQFRDVRDRRRLRARL